MHPAKPTIPIAGARRKISARDELPGSPVGYADNLSSVRLLELWQTRSMSDLTAAIEKLGKMDRFAGNAIMNSPSARTDAQRAGDQAPHQQRVAH